MQVIRDTARPLRDDPGDPVPNDNYGFGLVDAAAAVGRVCIKAPPLDHPPRDWRKYRLPQKPPWFEWIKRPPADKPPIFDPGGTAPWIDPIKQPGLDKPIPSDAGARGADPGNAPFALATPHHYEAGPRPAEAEGQAAHLQAAIVEHATALAQLAQDLESGAGGDVGWHQYQQLALSHQALVDEYEGLHRQA